MTAAGVRTFVLQARLAITRSGLSAAAGLVLATGAALLLAFVVQERNGPQPLEAPPQPLVTANEPVGSVAVRNLREFYTTLGERAEAQAYLKVLFAIAQEGGLNLDHGEYQWQFDKDGGFHRYRILLPIAGPYREIRQFCEEALRALPFAAIDEMSFRRESAGDETLAATLRFTLYLKDGGPAPQPEGDR